MYPVNKFVIRNKMFPSSSLQDHFVLENCVSNVINHCLQLDATCDHDSGLAEDHGDMSMTNCYF